MHCAKILITIKQNFSSFDPIDKGGMRVLNSERDRGETSEREMEGEREEEGPDKSYELASELGCLWIRSVHR